jgi:hypothetical protein
LIPPTNVVYAVAALVVLGADHVGVYLGHEVLSRGFAGLVVQIAVVLLACRTTDGVGMVRAMVVDDERSRAGTRSRPTRARCLLTHGRRPAPRQP